MSGVRPVAFLDRDGTIIADAHYISRPEQVALLPGSAEAIGRLNARGVAVIVVSNQSGIARRYFTYADFERVQARVEQLLNERGARLDAVYVCAHHPSVDGVCECRKPGALLFQRAIDEHGLTTARAWYVGDRWRDVAPADVLGGSPVLVPGPHTPADEVAHAAERGALAGNLTEAVDRILASL